MMARRCALLFMALACWCSGLASSDNTPKQRAAVGALQLQGAGATFPAPLYKKWVEEYQKQHPDVQLSYKAIGSGEGTKQFAQFLALCSRLKWSKHFTNSPCLALLAMDGSKAAYKIISACSNAVS